MAREILERGETLSNQVTAQDAAIYRELLMAAGIPTSSGIELLTVLLAYGQGRTSLSVSDRALIDYVLPASGRDFESKMRHLRHVRKTILAATDGEKALPIIQIDPGKGTIINGKMDGIPTAYALPILRLRQQVIRELPDDDPGSIRATAQRIIKGEFGSVVRKNDRGRRLKDVSAKTSIRTGISHFRRVAAQADGPQVINRTLAEELTPGLHVIAGRSLLDCLLTGLRQVVGQYGDQIRDPETIAHLVQTEAVFLALREQFEDCKNDSQTQPQVLSCQHRPEVTNFDRSGAKTPSKPTLRGTPEQAHREEGADPLPEGIGSQVAESASPVGLELSEAELEELSPLSQAVESVAVFESVGFSHAFLRLEDANRQTLRSVTLPMREAYFHLGELIAEADRLKASLMFRPTGERPQSRMTPEEVAADDAAVRPRAIHLDDISEEEFQKVRHLAGFGFESSPGNFQCVVFVEGDKPTVTGIRRRLVKGIGSDPGASGSYRLPGSGNWKPGRDGVRVKLSHVAHKRVLTIEQIEGSGLLAPPSVGLPSSPPQVARYHGPRKFPSYEKCIADARRKRDGVTTDYSAADLSFANISAARGFTPGEIETELTILRGAIDDKPRLNPRYISGTVAKAFLEV